MEMRDVMITPVVCAEDWQTLGHVRRVMLLHEFTVLPYRANGKSENRRWQFIEAEHVVKALSEGGDGVRSMTVKAAVEEEILVPTCAKTKEACHQVDPSNPVTTLVVTDKGDVAGIVTPFDLL